MQKTQTKEQFPAEEQPAAHADSLEQLLRKNLELTQEIYEHTRKTRSYIMFGQVITVIKIVLIIGPLILALVYLPPLIREALSTYDNLLGGGTGQTIIEGNDFLKDVLKRGE